MRRPAVRSLSISMAVTGLLVVVAGCGGSSGGGSGETAGGTPAAGSTGGATGGGELQKVSVGVIPIVDVAPIYLGKEKGFFKKHGIELSLSSAQGGAAIVPGVVSGQFQFGFSNVTSLIIAHDKGLPVKVVAAGNFSTGKVPDFSAVVVKKDSPIKDAKDLEGKTVSVNTLKNIGDTTVRESIRKAGGDPAKVKFVELAFPDMPAAVANGRVDAAWVVEPFVTIAKSQGDRVVAWNLVDTAPNLMIAAYFTSEKLEQSDPELVKNFKAAINESLDYAQAHQDEVRQIVPTYTKIDAKLVNKLTLPVWGTTINTKSTQRLADLALQDGLISKKADLSTLLP